MVVDSIRRGPYKQPIQVPQHARSWRRRRGVRLDDACGGSKQQLGPHQWPRRCLALRAQVQWPMAEQRESKLEGEVEVWCAKALQQRTRLVSTA
jgi:hypothetical protein